MSDREYSRDQDEDDFPDPDKEDDPEDRRESEKEDEPSTPSSNYLNAPPIYNEAFMVCVQAIRLGTWDSAKLIALSEAVSLVIPNKHITEFPQWKRLDAKYGRPLTVKRGTKITEQEYLDRYHVIVEIAKEVRIAGRAAEQGESARFLSFASVYPLREDL